MNNSSFMIASTMPSTQNLNKKPATKPNFKSNLLLRKNKLNEKIESTTKQFADAKAKELKKPWKNSLS